MRSLAWPCLAGAAVTLLLVGCRESAPAAPAPAAPVLDAATAERVVLAADDARRRAHAQGDPAPLVNVYSPLLFGEERRRIAAADLRGTATDEVADERRLAHWSGSEGGGEAVLAVRGRQRRTTAGSSLGAWVAFARQWEVHLGWSGERWLVSSATDLPPDRWWRT